MVTPSAPAAPPFALTLFHACHTICFGMANGFPSMPDMLTRLLPGQRPGCSGKQCPDEPAPSLRIPLREPRHYYGPVRHRAPRHTQRLAVSAAWRAPSRSRLITGAVSALSLIHISEPTRLGMISYAVFCLKKK